MKQNLIMSLKLLVKNVLEFFGKERKKSVSEQNEVITGYSK